MLKQVNVRAVSRSINPPPPLELPIGGPSSFPVSFIDGLTPANASMSMGRYANQDGEVFQSSRVDSRNIVLTLELEPNYALGESVEGLRKTLYRYFSPSNQLEMEFVNDQDVGYHISGYVESFEAPLFVQSPAAQISIVCPNPYFQSLMKTQMLDMQGQGFEEVVNEGDTTVGFRLQITYSPTGSPTSNGFYISNFMDDLGIANDLMVDGITIQKNDFIDLNTDFGNKSLYLDRGGARTNLLPHRTFDSGWLSLAPGANQISYSFDAASRYATITYRERYLGL